MCEFQNFRFTHFCVGADSNLKIPPVEAAPDGQHLANPGNITIFTISNQ